MKTNILAVFTAIVSTALLSNCASTSVQPPRAQKVNEHQPHLAYLRTVSRTGDGKEATQCVVRSIDGRHIDLKQQFVLLRPGDREVKFIYQKWMKDQNKKVLCFVSVKPICSIAQIKPGHTYYLDASGIHLEPAEGSCSIAVVNTQSHVTYAMAGKAYLVAMK